MEFFYAVHTGRYIYVTENTLHCFNKYPHLYFLFQLIIFFIRNNFNRYTLLSFTQESRCHFAEAFISFHIKIAF